MVQPLKRSGPRPHPYIRGRQVSVRLQLIRWIYVRQVMKTECHRALTQVSFSDSSPYPELSPRRRIMLLIEGKYDEKENKNKTSLSAKRKSEKAEISEEKQRGRVCKYGRERLSKITRQRPHWQTGGKTVYRCPGLTCGAAMRTNLRSENPYRSPPPSRTTGIYAKRLISERCAKGHHSHYGWEFGSKSNGENG